MKTEKTMLIMRWSNRRDFAVPFIVKNGQDIINGLSKYRAQRPTDGAELHVFIPSGRCGTWMPPRHMHHYVVSDRIKSRQQSVLPSGLVAEAITVLSPEADLSAIMIEARASIDTWGTSDYNPDNIAYAMRDNLTILRADLRKNISIKLDEDLLPDDPVKLRDLAYEAGLGRDYERAYPA